MNVVSVLAPSGTSHSRGVAASATSRDPSVRQRIGALDFIKGTLVVLMVVYHWLNYFVDVRWDVYRYLRFLTPSFIFITGFIVAYIYPVSAALDVRDVSARLWRRGVKLLLLFTCLNVATSLLVSQNHDGKPEGLAAFTSQAFEVYVSGNGRAVFDVLVPIAYFLLLAPFLMAASRRFRLTLPLVTAGALSLAWLMNVNGASSVTLELLSMAILGMLIGGQSLERIRQLGEAPGALVCIYLLYLAAITAWNVIFPLQILGVCLSILLIYVVAVWAGSAGWAQRLVIELGQYSLFCYIVQVIFLQVLRRGLRPWGLNGPALVVPFAFALLLTVWSVVILDWLRKRAHVVDRVYRVVFA